MAWYVRRFAQNDAVCISASVLSRLLVCFCNHTVLLLQIRKKCGKSTTTIFPDKFNLFFRKSN